MNDDCTSARRQTVMLCYAPYVYVAAIDELANVIVRTDNPFLVHPTAVLRLVRAVEVATVRALNVGANEYGGQAPAVGGVALRRSSEGRG